ncbi:MAG: hypothetical protein L6R41_003850 [Letrouitia leprolyta]|nr:MAG: hypothetical protein L6R41_003850 [Letrouitia leprolyta]
MQSLHRSRRALQFFRLTRSSPSTIREAGSFTNQTPTPPRLPKAEQELFEKLQRASTGAFSTPKPTVVVNDSQSTRPQINQSPSNSQPPPPPTNTSEVNTDIPMAKVSATGSGEELHPDVRRGAKPEFEGERNPKTGEVGGPKNEPLRWGGGVDWSYNGRVTDF